MRMIHNTKCECGHQNHVGTVLCESCGKPLTDEAGNEPLEMRYDGVARRSQRAKRTPLDRVWNFFSSVKIAVYLIIFTLLASAIGTIFPQEDTFINLDPATFYKDTYGWSGELYYLLGLSHTFDSWWFRMLLFMIGTSLVICSLDRVLPLYRALSKQQLRKHPSFILRQKVAFEGDLPQSGVNESTKDWDDRFADALRKKHYRVYREDGALLAEKNRFSRWGPYINHIGLIIFLLAALSRGIPGWHMNQYMEFLEGSPKAISGTNYYLLNNQFTVDFYNPDEMSEGFRQRDVAVPKVYKTDAILYECTADCRVADKQPVLRELTHQQIEVNKPLKYKDLQVFQFDYSETPELLSIKPMLTDHSTGQSYGPIDLQMDNPLPSYQAGPFTLTLKSFFPEFGLDDKGLPMTKSNKPLAPAFVFSLTGPGLPAAGSPYMYFPRQIDKVNFRQDDINGALGSRFDLSVGSMDDVKIAQYTSYLNIRVEKAMPYIWFGAAVSMIGLIMGFYWQHRRIWLRIDGARLMLGAHTNKNWFGIRKEVADALGKTGIDVDPKSLEKGRNRE
jgi:cytochrome c biogenesis protein